MLNENIIPSFNVHFRALFADVLIHIKSHSHKSAASILACVMGLC